VFVPVGCSDASSSPPVGDDAPAAAAGNGPTPGAAGNSFELGVRALTTDGLGTDVEALHLKPSAVADIVAHSRPAAAHGVRFALLGAPLDAVLSLTESSTDAVTGDAHVRLVAPSTPTTFRVQATATGAMPAFIDLAVPKTGMALLGVQPSYAGERVVPSPVYVASAWEGTTCADLPGSPPDEDGPLVASDAKFPVPLQVPTDTKLAVTLRASRFAWGCTTVNAATEGAQNEVEVVMTNVPMKLDESVVDFTLGLDTTEDFDAGLAEPEQAMFAAMLGGADDDVAALLDAMGSASSDFADVRESLGWDDVVREALGASAATAVRAPLARWIASALDQEHVASGLTGSLRGMPDGSPSVTLSSVFGVAPSRAGFTPSDTASWEASADDRVVIGMSMSVLPATFLLGAARGPALDEVSGAKSISAALAAVVSCADVAAALVAHGESKNDSTKGCAADCTEQLCVNGVRALVDAATASDDGPTTLDIALTGSARVGEDAQLTGFGGGDCTWLGHWSLPEGTMNLSGPAKGAAPEAVTP
jgi:hypothetical protein